MLSSKPNPFNPKTEIQYSLPKDSFVELTIYDVRGHKVTELVSGNQTSGPHSVDWEGRDGHGRSVASGIYLCQMKAAGISMSRRITLIR